MNSTIDVSCGSILENELTEEELSAFLRTHSPKGLYLNKKTKVSRETRTWSIRIIHQPNVVRSEICAIADMLVEKGKRKRSHLNTWFKCCCPAYFHNAY